MAANPSTPEVEVQPPEQPKAQPSTWQELVRVAQQNTRAFGSPRQPLPSTTDEARIFAMFNALGRRAIERAQDAAQTLRHSHLSDIHLLCGVVNTTDSLGEVALRSLGITPEIVLAYLMEMHTVSTKCTFAIITDPALMILETATLISHGRSTCRDESPQSKAFDIPKTKPEDILLALLDPEEGLSDAVLEALGTSRDELRDRIVDIIVFSDPRLRNVPVSKIFTPARRPTVELDEERFLGDE